MIKYLESFSSDNKTYDHLKIAAYRGLVEGKIEIGTALMKDAEKLFNKKEYHQAKEEYKDTQMYFEGFRNLAVEHGLEDEKGKIEGSIDACIKNIRSCVDAMVARRDVVAEEEIVKVADLEKGIISVVPARKGQPMFSLPEELHEYYHQLEYIGEGGNSSVYRAQRKKDGVMVAIKIARYWDEKTSKSFMNEIKI